MKFIILLLGTFLTANSYSATSGEMCFHSHKLMDMHNLIYTTVADNMFLQSKIENKPLIQTFVKPSDEKNHCLTAEGDDKIIAVIRELYDENKKDLFFPGTTEIKDIKVEVFIGGIDAPFLSLPGMNSNVLYDVDKTPVTVSARMLHPKIIELTYAASWGNFTKNFHVDELIWCIYPIRDRLGKRETTVQDHGIVLESNFANPSNAQPHYLKIENTYKKIVSLSFRAALK